MPKHTIEDHHLKEPRYQGKALVAFCPYHDDQNTPNLHIFEDRTRFKCHACGEGGNAYKFLQDQGALPEKKQAAPTKPIKLPTQGDIDKAHNNLFKNHDMVEYLKDKRGWNIDTIKKYQLGLINNKITIPIYKDGKPVNIRLYDVQHTGGAKFKSWATGLGTRVDLYPDEPLKETIIIHEGEPDTTLMRQHGFDSHCLTGGVENIKDKHLNIFKGKNVIIIGDIDDVGKRWANRVTLYLSHLCPSVKNVQLPITEPKNGDVTDYILKLSKGKKSVKTAIQNLIDSTPVFVAPVDDRDVIKAMDATKMTLEEAGQAVNVMVKQSFKAVVSGKAPEPYLIPAKIGVSCSSPMHKTVCSFCALGDKENHIIELGPYDPEILQIVGMTQDQAKGVYHRLAKVAGKCAMWKFETLENQNVEDVDLMPVMDYDSAVGSPHISRRAIVVSQTVETNRSYIFKGWTVPHPTTHHVIHLVEKAEHTLTAIDEFVITDEIKERLEIFKPSRGQTVLEKLDHIYEDLENNVTHIWGRRDLICVIDLVYHSVLKFKFQGFDVRRGWVEALIIGDTRCGKSETITQLINHYKAGELVNSENMSYAGLVGGVNITGNRKVIAWGKLPLNDGRLVALDEFSGIGKEEIEKLSGVRASGIAEITKIRAEKTWARVRLLIMSNPRYGNLADYSHGIGAITKLIGKSEDIARFDLALTVASGEVGPEKINVQERPAVDHIYTSAACADRIRWIWSRTDKQIRFSNAAVQWILKLATEQSSKYHSSIPLVEPSEQRIKLARLSVSVAGMMCSTRNWDNINVDTQHVEAAYQILEDCYNKDSMGYDIYSQAKFREETIGDEENVRDKLLSFGMEGILMILSKDSLLTGDIEDIVGADKKYARWLAAFFVKRRCLKRPRDRYLKTPAFTKFLVALKKEVEKNPLLIDEKDEYKQGQQTMDMED